MKWEALILILGSMPSIPVVAQNQASSLITQSINEAKVVTLRGNVHPLAQARYDVGAAPSSMPAKRLMLLLNRPADRGAALAEYMRDVHTPGAAIHHRWLTPEEFGARFGPADSDIQQVSDWLSGMGFQVAGASKGKTLIEFSGTVGQVNKAFHTQIRKYAVKGEVHYANATDPQIPEALAGVVRGVSSLNNFRPRSNLHVVGPAHLDAATRKIVPDFTMTGQSGPIYAVAPEDFATQYDLAPLYAAGINGSGKTIGIINDSNIDVNLDNAYRTVFGLPANPAQVVLDGGDPGINADDTEAYLDVEMAGAVAPGATVNLYIASWDTVADALDFPLILAARRAIEDNQADVLSVSFNECEGFIGTADNLILAALWQQAAAQGQTVFVSAGDNGSAGCDNANTQFEAIYGLQVNGFASTPWNVAVGGTDFYYSDYASGAPSAANLWNATNDANFGSLKAPLPEQVWNDSFGFDAVNPNDTYNFLYTIAAGSGGASSCINSAAAASGSALPFFCSPVSGTIYGYAKPSWQSGPGVPADGVRDLPDVSLFAANGYNLSSYPICANPGDCAPGTNQQTPVTLVGGTSASAPAMAAIMALIDQKYGRQGQADYTFYALAQQKPSAFHDITMGGNNVPCVEYNGVFTPNCGPNTGGTIDPGFNTLSGYPATTGYDLASGLGSVDANVLVSSWDSITFAPTATSLQLSSASFTHGTPVTVKVSVESSGGEKPQGGISILTNSPLPARQSVDFLTLGSNGSASGSINSLPGGTYQVWADYGGDGLHSSSNSSPVSVTVTPEASSIGISAVQTTYSVAYNPAVGCTPVVGPLEEGVVNGSSVPPYTPLWLTVQPRGSASNPATATGSVTFTLDGQPASVPLNVSGIATWITPMSAGAGTHAVVASYAGDASYGAATSSPFTYIVQPIPIFFGINPFAVSLDTGMVNGCYPGNQCSAYTGDNLPVLVSLDGSNCQLPTGTVTVTLGSQTQTVSLTPVGFPLGEGSMGLATFPNLQAGTYQLTGAYSGDSFYPSASAGPYTLTVASSTDPLLPTTTVVTESPSVISYYGGTTLSVTVTTASGSKGPPTGYVNIYGDGGWSLWQLGIVSSGPNTSTGSFSLQQNPNLNAFGPYIGLDQITAVYLGDSNYQLSVSAPIQLNIVSTSVFPDFIVAPQVNQMTVQSGSSATVGINLAPQNGFSGPVALTCAPSSSQVTCSLNPATVTVNGPATTALTITVAAQALGLPAHSDRYPDSGSPGWLGVSGGFMFASVLVGGLRSRKRRLATLLLGLFAALFFATGCGSGGGSQNIQPPPPPPTLTTYSVVVSAAAANGIVHNTKITVVVP
ncbi:MAG: Ig-like domain repeat protein [Terriglobales bacterium]